jgi:hypothetical protein
MKGAGFRGDWIELPFSYRLPSDAMALARDFAKSFMPTDTTMLPYEPQSSLGLEPCELRWVQTIPLDADKVCTDEIIRLFQECKYKDMSFADVTFLCDTREFGWKVVTQLGKRGIRAVHTYHPDDVESRRQKIGFYMGDARIKATTLHSFKGWESRFLVIYLEKAMSSNEYALLYAGLTRLKRHPKGSCLTVITCEENLRKYGTTWPNFVNVCDQDIPF